MKNTKQFIEDAIEGGFNIGINESDGEGWDMYWKLVEDGYYINGYLLQPEFWQAVSETRGWARCVVCGRNQEEHGKFHDFEDDYKIWKKRWHKFIDHLADGLTIEESLDRI